MQLFTPPLNNQAPAEDAADEQDISRVAQTIPPAKAAIIQDNVATDAATQRNKARGPATRIIRNEAHGRNTTQENSASNCLLM